MAYYTRIMKTPIHTIFLLPVMTALLLTGCSKEEKPQNPTGKPTPPAKPTFGQPSNTAVRALPSSSFGKSSTEKPKRPKSSNQDLLTVIDTTTPSKEKRLAALATLGRDLDDNDVLTLIDFLNIYDDADALPPEKLNVVKNDITNLLRGQKHFPSSLPWRLMAMWRDTNHDVVWRDYCIQHAGASMGRMKDSTAKTEAVKFFYEVASSPDAPGSGTAMIALRNLVNRGKENKSKVAECAMTSAASDSAPQGTRVTALQIAAELGHPEAAPVARTLVNDRTKTMHLRVSAIAALGISGDKSDIPVLEKLSNSSNYRLRLAANAAVGKIKPSEK